MLYRPHKDADTGHWVVLDPDLRVVMYCDCRHTAEEIAHDLNHPPPPGLVRHHFCASELRGVEAVDPNHDLDQPLRLTEAEWAHMTRPLDHLDDLDDAALDRLAESLADPFTVPTDAETIADLQRLERRLNEWFFRDDSSGGVR